uniref:Uncharacterized protein n=1 Tax=Leersia perrieri TaxID=77586 RepID=A0A0D9XAP7_9ORYZ
MQSCFKHRESDLSGISQQLHHPTTLLISCSSSLLADLPELFLRLLGQADVRLDCCIVASLDGQQHLQGARLELGEALLHGVAEIKQDHLLDALQLFFNIDFAGARAGWHTRGSRVECHGWDGN